MADEGVSILETESYTLAIVFLVFLAVFVTVEKAGLDAVKSELMLFGVASLLLSVLENPITSICIHVPSSQRWTILSQLNGCECCLSHTKAISKCFLDFAGCGNDFCNCNNADPTCLAEAQPSSHEAEVTECAGATPYSVEECGNRPGYKQALTSRSITQIHKMLFYIAVSHIVCSVIMSKIATARIQIWKRWLSDDDAHSTAVHLTLQQFADSALQRERLKNDTKDKSLREAKLPVWRALAKSFSSSSRKQGFPDLAQAQTAESDNKNASDDLVFPAPSPPMDKPLHRSSRQLDNNQTSDLKEDLKGREADESDPSLQEQSLHGDESNHNQEGSNSSKTPTHIHGRHRLAVVKPGPGQIHHDAAQMLWHKTVARVSCATPEHVADGGASPQTALPQTEVEVCLADEEAAEAAEDTASKEHNDIAVDICLPDEVVVEHSRRWAGRKAQLHKRRQYSWEYAKCFLRQFRLQTIQHAEMSIMRASFILTHRPGRKFKFMEYILASLDDDVAKVVGLGWSVWLVVIVFVLLAGVMGWAAAWFELLAVVLELIMNTKLIYIARHTARGGKVHRLKPTIFWFGGKGPWVMLLAIKTLLFLVSFIFASLIFFAVNFGPRSCFFATPGLNTASLPIPWWVILIVNVVVYLALSFVTLPLYSLGVQMGSDFRPHILSPNIKNRLLNIAQENKEKVRQRKLEEGREGKYKGKFRRLSGRVSGSGQRWRRQHLSSRSA